MMRHAINTLLAIILVAGGAERAEAATTSAQVNQAMLLTQACMVGSIQTSLNHGYRQDEELVMTSVAVCGSLLLSIYRQLPNPPSKEWQARALVDQGISVLRELKGGAKSM